MSINEIKCRGNVYYMHLDEKGNERHANVMTLSGHDCTGEPYMRAHAGKFPNLNYVIPFGEAYDFLCRWWGSSMSERLRKGENMTLAYIKDNRQKRVELVTGDSIYEIAYDINYKAGKYYTKDGTIRFKFVFTKV